MKLLLLLDRAPDPGLVDVENVVLGQFETGLHAALVPVISAMIREEDEEVLRSGVERAVLEPIQEERHKALCANRYAWDGDGGANWILLVQLHEEERYRRPPQWNQRATVQRNRRTRARRSRRLGCQQSCEAPGRGHVQPSALRNAVCPHAFPLHLPPARSFHLARAIPGDDDSYAMCSPPRIAPSLGVGLPLLLGVVGVGQREPLQLLQKR
mmetsp:Transcript_21619/g.40710  ORF Transcript_21619/g.40710 Transcript_21619/m.40710 type:complete len:212 (-) Transcript_21619:323-958(-)